ncbi:MAG TPA: pyruvate, water dikinase regulatory protein [Alphaproteobacteria bacterium]|nr:pyruvate, water dikinase regulatory protein [Alphaproteobacteria bacterium]
MTKTYHVHLVSDATGETINSVMRACLVQFEDGEADVTEHSWSLVRTPGQMDRALAGIRQNPGLVLYTIVNDRLREQLVEGCRAAQIQSVAVLDPVISAMAAHFGQKARGQSGRQHELDAEYFDRIEAMNFALSHDDGQSSRTYNDADVILIGVSRSSKTPTCIYLANRGIKCANVPIVPNCPMPPELFTVKKPLVVGLTKDATQLVQIRKNRLQMIARDEDTDYVDLSVVREEVAMARRLCTDHGWPVIDVTRRSIEETAATIIQLLQEHQENAAAKQPEAAEGS